MSLPPRAAAIRGDDLQHAIGWHWACQMLNDADIESVSIEDSGGGSFDDIVVRRRTGPDLYIQAKSSNYGGTVVDGAWLTTPASSGGKSPLQHFYETYVTLSATGQALTLELVTTRPFDPGHPLIGGLRDAKSEKVNTAKVAAAGQASAVGKARDEWAAHLKVTAAELIGFLDAVTWSHCPPEPKWLSQTKPLMELAGLRTDDEATKTGARIVHDWVTDGRGPQNLDDLRAAVAAAGLLATDGTLVLQVNGIDDEPQPMLPNYTLDFVDLYVGADSFARKLLRNSDDWAGVVLPAFTEAARALSAYRVRRVHITGSLRHPMWFAAGRALPEVKRWKLSVEQLSGIWRTDEDPEDVAPRVMADSDLGLTADPTPQVVEYVTASGLPVGRVIVFGPEGTPSRTSVPGGAWTMGWTRAVREAVRARVAEVGATRVHLFFACPAGVALMLGHQWNMLPPTTVYEYTDTYSPTATFDGT